MLYTYRDARSVASHFARKFIRAVRTCVKGVPIFRAWSRQAIMVLLNFAAARAAVPPLTANAESCLNSSSVHAFLFMIDSAIISG